MNRPENLNNSEDLNNNQESELSEDARIEQEIQSEQSALVENVKELEGDVDQLEELEGEEDLSTKAKNALKAGLAELKDFILANPTMNMLSSAGIAGIALRGVFEHFNQGKDIKDVATEALGQLAALGIIKSVAYLGWGRKARMKEVEKAQKEAAAEEGVATQENQTVSDQSISESEAELPPEDTESEIKKLKDDLNEKYDEEKAE